MNHHMVIMVSDSYTRNMGITPQMNTACICKSVIDYCKKNTHHFSSFTLDH